MQADIQTLKRDRDNAQNTLRIYRDYIYRHMTELEKQVSLNQAALDAYTERLNNVDKAIVQSNANYGILRQEWDAFKANPAVQALDTSGFEKALTKAETDAQASAQAFADNVPPAQTAQATDAGDTTATAGQAANTDDSAGTAASTEASTATGNATA